MPTPYILHSELAEFIEEIEKDPEAMALFHDFQDYLREIAEEDFSELKHRKIAVRKTAEYLFSKYW